MDSETLDTMDKVALIFFGGLIGFVLGHLVTIYILIYIPLD